MAARPFPLERTTKETGDKSPVSYARVNPSQLLGFLAHVGFFAFLFLTRRELGEQVGEHITEFGANFTARGFFGRIAES